MLKKLFVSANAVPKEITKSSIGASSIIIVINNNTIKISVSDLNNPTQCYVHRCLMPRKNCECTCDHV